LRTKIVTDHTISICRLSMQRPPASGVETKWGAYHFFETILVTLAEEAKSPRERDRGISFQE
jgi:hypothetical protein